MSAAGHTVYVAGAAAVSAFGFDWRGLGRAVEERAIAFAPSMQLAATHGAVTASEVAEIPAALDVDARARKLMSHPARLAAVALRLALLDTAWPDQWRDELGLFLGVGASGASMAELTGMLDASIVDHQFSLDRFGDAGLTACNPLFAFQLMNNFTLCHGAILNSTGGPNSAFYSRGTGTVAALSEAHWLLASGACERALAGGADSALHPVTWSQLRRDAYVEGGLIAGEGAGLLALTRHAACALAILDHAEFHSAVAFRRDPQLLMHTMLADAGAADLVVLAPWGNEARDLLQQAAAAHCPGATVIDLGACLGDALAAAPALAWCTALDLLQSGSRWRALILNAGIDGGVGMVALRSLP